MGMREGRIFECDNCGILQVQRADGSWPYGFRVGVTQTKASLTDATAHKTGWACGTECVRILAEAFCIALVDVGQ